MSKLIAKIYSMKAVSKITLIGVVLINLTISCVHDTEVNANYDNLNTFKMIIDEQVWRPSAIDSCYRTFRCDMSLLNGDKFYKIDAYRDPLSKTDLMSEHYFEIKIMNVNETGNYIIDGAFEDFSNYARLTINEDSGKRRYQNKESGNSFRVDITHLFPIEGSAVIGIGGSFEGTLFNLDNPSDSITITEGEFIFRKTNHGNSFNQCKE